MFNAKYEFERKIYTFSFTQRDECRVVVAEAAKLVDSTR